VVLHEGFVGRDLMVYLLVLDHHVIFLVNLGHILLNLSPKLIVELVLKGAHFQFDTCQIDYVL
jgi:hypothetical protein